VFPELEVPSAPPESLALGGRAESGDGVTACSSEQDSETVQFPAEVNRPSVMEQVNVANGHTILHWAVDAKKLESQDKQQVSPQFEVRFPGHSPQTFQLVIYPTVVNDGRRGAGFKKAKGRGRVVLKCQSVELPEGFPYVSFSISIGKGDLLQPLRGPTAHNFRDQSCGGLPKKKEEWDFKSGVDDSRTVAVNVELWPSLA